MFQKIAFSFFIVLQCHILQAHDSDIHQITLNKTIHSKASCEKLLSPLSLQKTLNFVFSQDYEQKGNDLIISYKNVLNEERKLTLEILKADKQLSFLIKKGLFKNLFLKLTYTQTNYCDVSAHLEWQGEEKRFSKSFLEYIIEHYLDKLMSFLNRLA